MILVTGSTGHLGNFVIEALLESTQASQIIAAARSPEKAQDLAEKGVQVREFDYDRPETMDAALEGVEKILLISSSDVQDRVGQHRRVIEAAKRADVALIAYTSILDADNSQLMLAEDHKATERMLRDSGLPWVFLRNGWYSENYFMDLEGTIDRGVMVGAAGDGRVSPASREDYAQAAAAVLLRDGQEGKIYELAGDESLSYDEIAEAIASVSGEEVVYKDLSREAYQSVLEGAGVPQGFAAVLADSDVGVSNGALDSESRDLHELIGRRTTPFIESVKEALDK